VTTVKHTPGPWTWFDYPDGRKLLCAPSRAVIHCPDAPVTCAPEDQRLIAAAPELLAALKRTMTQARGAMRASGSDAEFVEIALSDAHAALAKAEGTFNS
jgi:hypothetical protein